MPNRRGFASMAPERQRAIASMGGRAAHAQGTAHEWDTAEARAAGMKGGRIGARKRWGDSPFCLCAPGGATVREVDGNTYCMTCGKVV